MLRAQYFNFLFMLIFASSFLVFSILPSFGWSSELTCKRYNTSSAFYELNSFSKQYFSKEITNPAKFFDLSNFKGNSATNLSQCWHKMNIGGICVKLVSKNKLIIRHTSSGEIARYKCNGNKAAIRNAVLANKAGKKKVDDVDLSKFSEFRRLEFTIDGRKHDSFSAFNQGRALIGFKANGILFFEGEVCTWESSILNAATKTGNFDATCPSGMAVKGKYTYNGEFSGSSGNGWDINGRAVAYTMKGSGSSSKAEIQSYYQKLKNGEAETVSPATEGIYANKSDTEICDNSLISNLAKNEARKRGLNCSENVNLKNKNLFEFSSPDYPDISLKYNVKLREMIFSASDEWFDDVFANVKNTKTARVAFFAEDTSDKEMPDFSPSYSANTFSTASKKSIVVDLSQHKISSDVISGRWLRLCLQSQNGAWWCSAGIPLADRTNSNLWKQITSSHKGTNQNNPPLLASLNDKALCEKATYKGSEGRVWHLTANQRHVSEAKRRGLNCQVNSPAEASIANTSLGNSSFIRGQNLPDCPSDTSATWTKCFGKYGYESSNTYIGEWLDNEEDGLGTYIFGPESEWAGDKYVGEFERRAFSGKGIYYHSSGNLYFGEFRDSERNGWGTFVFGSNSDWSGDKFLGEFVSNEFHGLGTYVYANGNKDVGEFKNGKLDGFAISFDKYGQILRQGVWGNDQFLRATDSKPNSSSLPSCPSDTSKSWTDCFGTYDYDGGDSYTGEWRDNKRHGQGIYTYSKDSKWAGDIFIGEYASNKRIKGTYVFGPNSEYSGHIYSGFYGAEGDFQGFGTYVYADNSKEIGSFKNDQLNGFAISLSADGSIERKGMWEDDKFQYVSEWTADTHLHQQTIDKNQNEDLLLAAQREAERLREELAQLQANQNTQQKQIISDTDIPVITADSRPDGETNRIVFGKIQDNVAIEDAFIDGEPILLDGEGFFETSVYVPRNGKSLTIIAFDKKGNKASLNLRLNRDKIKEASGPLFASLNPAGKRAVKNNDALALIIGVANYERTPAKAAFADKDAQIFYDYALLKLGIPAQNIKELVNTNADEVDVRLAVKDWIARTTKQGKTDIYVFFAGHGLADQTGEQMYLLPHDGEPRLLEDTAISRGQLFSDISAANPRSVTVFLDTCYSGTTRGKDMLIASRPIAIRAIKQTVPEGFTVFTAAGGDQTAKPLAEAEHGMFSYFLMKGMEGDADANRDNKITASELHEFVRVNVIQQSSGSQVPELQGDAERVLVKFQ